MRSNFISERRRAKGEKIKRRTCLKTILAAGASAAGTLAAGPGHPIQLHVDLAVDPAKEKEMLHNFETIFRPEPPNTEDILM